MNKIIGISAAFWLSLFLSACSTAVKKPQPYGDWQDANPPTVNAQQGGK